MFFLVVQNINIYDTKYTKIFSLHKLNQNLSQKSMNINFRRLILYTLIDVGAKFHI